ncbi:hypothetical protein [Siphonobacter sp. SORGH_AS_0500]|uniref:hypothetical protein n=1 Tax=Siphonobacter sp. SORGH_AS_0500 TaxID=1864824 RepID=UPI0028591EF4|nr:hypothetical protein [Siphonobacter sp. SORGH_AS_0500]MDR6195185.1 hypothetical protein [Siphonobacter sp. SORGH_AS_0500]
MDSLNLSDFATSLTDFARDNRLHIFASLLIPGMAGIAGTPIWAIEDYMQLIPGNDEVVLTQLAVANVLQPGNKGSFNPTQNAVKFKNRRAKVRPVKVDLEFTQPTIMKMYKSYMGQVTAKKIDPETYPLEAYVIDAVIAKAKENLRVISLFNGVYNENGNSPLDIFDGILTQVTKAIAAGNVPADNIVEVAPTTGENAVANHEKVIQEIPDAYFYGSDSLICLTNRKLLSAYETDYRKKFGTLPYNTSTEKAFIDGTNIPFVVEPGLSTLEEPIFTTKDNLCYLYDDEGKQDSLEFDYNKRDRSLAYMLDYQAGTGIGAAELLWMGQSA